MQVWRHRMADWVTKLEASRALTYRAAEQLAAGDPEGELTVSMSKLYGAELIRGLIPDCAHAFGGYGFIDETPVSRFYRDAKILEIGEGTSEIQRLVIARNLGLPVRR